MGANGEIMYSSPSLFLISLLYPCASSHILSSDAYYVEVSKYDLWSAFDFKCFIFCLQLSICQHLMQSTSLFDLVFIMFSLFMNVVHSAECLRIMCFVLSSILVKIGFGGFFNKIVMECVCRYLLACNMVFSLRECLVFSIEYKRSMFFIYFLLYLTPNHLQLNN
jgi:hypothetical protein